MIATLITVSVLAAPLPADDAAGIAFFEKRIRPLLTDQCYQCHSTGAKKLRGSLLLDSQEGWMDGGDSGPVIEPGKPDASLLARAISYEDPKLQMPPRGKLSDREIADLREWIAMGAPDPRSGEAPARAEPAIDIDKGREFWAYRPFADPVAPTVADHEWPLDDIDRFVLEKLESEGLRPVGDADRRSWLRRLSFDLTGLPPTPGEVRAFVEDESGDACDKAVDRLLASERFGERWGRHWLDVARFGESTGRSRDYPLSHAWRFRDWVIDAFNADLPYDRFITEQVAGDLLPAESREQLNDQRTATAFLAIGPTDLNVRGIQFTMDNIDEQIDATTRAILALTVSCARCHDHKFDPIPTADYYALAGIFRSTEILSGIQPGNQGAPYRADLLYPLDDEQPTEARVTPAARNPREVQKELQQLRNELRTLTQSANRARNRKNDRRKNDKADAAPAGDADDSSGAESTGEAERDDPSARIAELEARIRAANDELKELQKKARRNGSPAPEVSRIMGVRDAERATNCRICVRGEVSNLGAEVPRGFVRVVGNADGIEISTESSGRLELARWLSSTGNPLTARVWANRIWQHLFGRGIVRTVDNFGASGERPTHPELLDHLATRLIRGAWSTKALIRAIVLTRTYRLASRADEVGDAKDPSNVWFWRASPRRLDAESLRDALLFVSGDLDLSRPAASPIESLPVADLNRGGQQLIAQADESRLRSVYLPVLRAKLPELLATFDFADPNIVKGERDITTVATQALYFLNSPFVRAASEVFAKRLLADADFDDADRVALAYRLAFARSPQSDETQRMLEYLRGAREAAADEVAWSRLCQAIFASAEFRYLD